MAQAAFERGEAVAGRLREYSNALAADAWALEQALDAYRAGPEEARAAAARRIDEQVVLINAEVFGIEGGEGSYGKDR